MEKGFACGCEGCGAPRFILRGSVRAPMRAFPVLLVSLALVSLAPLAASHHGQPVGCDYDDDLYNNCHAGDLYWVTGPGCVGVRYGSQAPCHPLLDPTLLA